VNVLAFLHIANAPAVDGAPHRLAHLLLVALQKAFPIAYRLVFSRQATVDDLLEHL
jgi:hypothetical protein